MDSFAVTVLSKKESSWHLSAIWSQTLWKEHQTLVAVSFPPLTIVLVDKGGTEKLKITSHTVEHQTFRDNMDRILIKKTDLTSPIRQTWILPIFYNKSCMNSGKEPNLWAWLFICKIRTTGLLGLLVRLNETMDIKY